MAEEGKPIKRGPKGGKKHQPGHGHDRRVLGPGKNGSPARRRKGADNKARTQVRRGKSGTGFLTK